MLEGIELPFSSMTLWIFLGLGIIFAVLLGLVADKIPKAIRGFVGTVTGLGFVVAFFYVMFYLEGYKWFM